MTSSFEPILKKGTAAVLPEPEPQFDPAKHVSPSIAHELNNILAIVQGYTERLVLNHPGDVELQKQLKMIVDAARRAALIIREATPPI